MKRVLGVAGLMAFLLTATSAALAQTTTAANASFDLKMLAQCAHDPDPLGLVSDDSYADCDAEQLNAIGEKIARSFVAKGVVVAKNAPQANGILTVTLTKYMLDDGVGGIVGDFTSTIKIEGTYRLTDTAGRLLRQGPDSAEGDADDNAAVQQKFADNLVLALGNLAVGNAGAAPPGSLGTEVSSLPPSLAEGLGRPGLTGALVMGVVPGSRADRAGIKVGDIVLQFGGKPLADAAELVSNVKATPQGQRVELTLVRGKSDLKIVVNF